MQINSPLKKGFALVVIVLFIGASTIPLTGSKSVEKTSFDPVPDLDCDGDLYIVNVEPGSTVTGSFTVSNIGEPYSLLDWEIESYPEWGTWTFIPSSGNDLTPEDGVMTVEVEIGVPDEIEYGLWGEVKVVNLENYSDFDIIIVFLKWKSVPVVKNINQQFTTSLINQNILNTVSSTKNMEQSSMPTFNEPTIVSIQPPSQTVEKGETFEVSIYIEPGEPIIGIYVDYLYFDPNLIHANSVTFHAYFGNPWWVFWGTIDNVNGEIRDIYEFTLGGDSVTEPGTWVTMEFEAQQQSGTSYLDLEGVIISNETGGEVPLIINDGLVIVGGGANNPPNTPSQPSGPEFVCLFPNLPSELEFICICNSDDYSTSTTDPDGDNVSYGWDWNGDLIVDEWTGWYESGENCTVSHDWYVEGEGEYYVRVKAKDTFEYESEWSDPLFVIVDCCWPPSEPSNPHPEDGAINVSIDTLLFWTGGSPDPGTTVLYDIYFGTTSPPPQVATGHIETTYVPGTMNYSTQYYWQIIAWDNHGLSTTGPIWTFTTAPSPNNLPNAPDIDGPTRGKAGVEYDYTFVAIDPDEDNIFYYIEWGDDNVEDWFGPYDSDEEVTIGHTWDEQGTYTIKAKAKDIHDAESDWGYLEVTMPRNRLLRNTLLLRLLERFPNAFPLLRYLLGLTL